MLEDGVVTEQEINELTERYNQCIADKGYDRNTFHFEFDGSGSSNVSPGFDGDAFNTATMECRDHDGIGGISQLVTSLKLNPENKDMAKAVVDCLKRNKVVDADYNRQDYLDDSMTGSGVRAIPESDSRYVVVQECTTDPFGTQ